MDNWKYNSISEGKNVWLSEEVDYQVDDHNCKSKLIESESKPMLNVENYPLISNTQALDRLDFMDLGFADDIRKSYSISSEPSGEVFSDEIGTSDYHPQLGEDRESNDFMQSNDNQDFSLVDLKLGSLADGGIARSSELSKVDVPESSVMLSPSGKRARPTTPSCQVLGCNKDLGSFKSYYKRHKVCDVHTKTPKVIVDGIEQRFCQQCSRFHLLNEFDDIKRSCRRRLAAHNKRRRRPQVTSESGSGIIDFSSSLAFPEGMPNVFLGSSKYEGSEDSIRSSNFHLQMGCVEDNTDKIPEIPKGDMFSLMKPTTENTPCIQHTTSRALSLLSSQSQSISSHLLQSTSTTLVNKSSHADSINHSAGIIKRIAQSGPHTSGIYLMEADKEGPSTLNPSNGNTVGLQLQNDGISSRPSIKENDCVNPKGHGIILNLLQLSSHLERVEHQRHSTENEAG